jgi:hypothetical protein
MEKMKTLVWPVLAALVFGMLLLPVGFGFLSEGTAVERENVAASNATEAATLALQVPLCVQQAQLEPAKLAEVMAMSSYKQDDGVKAAGWATYPANADSSLTRALDQGCAEALREL